MTPEQLFEKHIKLATYVAKSFRESGEFDEIMQLARIGLFKACQRFDPSYGCPFSTYAVPVIRVEVIRGYFEVRDVIKIPRLIREDRAKVNRYLEVTEDVNELSKLTGIPPNRIKNVFASFVHGVDSFDQRSTYSADVTLGEMIGVEEDWDASIQLYEFLNALEERDKILIKMKLQGSSQSDIGKALGISQAHVSRVLVRIRKRYEQFISWEVELV